LYNVAFGDLNFTEVKHDERNSKKLYTKEKHHTSLLVHLFTFDKDFKVDNTIFEKYFIKEYSIRNKRDRYLKAKSAARVQNLNRILRQQVSN
jgi:hypothetical protein